MEDRVISYLCPMVDADVRVRTIVVVSGSGLDVVV
jgi:hypothetical protein